MTFEIISTGSKGNAVVLNGEILIDCGVPFKMLQEVKRKLRLVLLTHIHSDHFNPATVRALASERPTLRWCCCSWMVQPLLEAGVDRRMIDVAEFTEPGHTSRALIYDGLAIVNPEPLVHDVPNCCWHISNGHEWALYATDTATLEGISAKNYNLYLIEGNHKRDEIQKKIHDKEKAGEFTYEKRAAATHLSEEQAYDWLAENMGPNSQYVFLHRHEERK